MIDISKVEVTGFEPAIRGCRNPMNSWEKSDSAYCYEIDCDGCPVYSDGDCMLQLSEYIVGPNDLALMSKLAKAGTEHSKYRRMIIVTCDITAPLYWWKEYDTYKVGTVANSCSTMHKIAAKEFEWNDFSFEHWTDIGGPIYGFMTWSEGNGRPFTSGDMQCLYNYILETLNKLRELYLETKDKKYWWQMIQLLPTSYNQKRTVQLSYENLAAIYRQRKDHKLDEWHTFCDWIKTLPYAKEIITMEEKVDES